MGDVVLVWLAVGASGFALAAVALSLAKSLLLRGPRRLLQSGLDHLNEGDFELATRDFSRAQRKAYARGDLRATAAAWRGLAQIRTQRGDAAGAAAAAEAALDAERQSQP